MTDLPRIEDLRRRVQQDPASIAFAQLAEEYRRSGRFDDAIAVCRAGLACHDGYVSARVTLGRALLQSGQFADARHELERVLAVAPENLAAIRGLAEAHQQSGSLGDALVQFQSAHALAPNDPEIERSLESLNATLAQRPTEAPVPPPPPRRQRLLQALEQWLTAIHVTRAHRSA
jgi:tetratricopeptide (TPR) repeat protein